MDQDTRRLRNIKQSKIKLLHGRPNVFELKEGLPELRVTDEGLVEYVRYNDVLFKKVFDKGTDSVKKISNYAYFGVNYVQFSNVVANKHYPIPFGGANGGATGTNDVDFGTGTDPDATFTTADTDTQYASQIVPMLWRIPDSIVIESVSHIEGADDATGDTTRMHLKSFKFTSGATACLTEGNLIAHNDDITNVGNEQPYLSSWTINNSRVSADRVVLCFFRNDSVNSDYSINVTVKYHLV